MLGPGPSLEVKVLSYCFEPTRSVIVVLLQAYSLPTFSPDTKPLLACWLYRKYQMTNLFMNVTWWFLLMKYLYATACVAMATQEEFVCCYNIVTNSWGCIANARRCSSTPACVHFACRVQKFIQGCKQAVPSHCLQNYSQWKHGVLVWLKFV